MAYGGGVDPAQCSPGLSSALGLGLCVKVEGLWSFQATSLEWLLRSRDCPSKQVRGWLVEKGVLIVTGVINMCSLLSYKDRI